MRPQQKIWLEEHTNKSTLPTMAKSEPTQGVKDFVEWLQSNSVALKGNAVDIGSGKGRNSVYLGKCGFQAWGLEYIEPAIESSNELAKNAGVEANVTFVNAEIDTDWQFDDDFFDIAIDSFSSIDIETFDGRQKCRNELYRCLKPGGYAFINACSAEDEWEKELIANHPGPENNSTIWPDNGKFQKDYDEAELRKFYKDFQIIELKEMTKPAHKLGRDGIATNFWAVLKKP